MASSGFSSAQTPGRHSAPRSQGPLVTSRTGQFFCLEILGVIAQIPPGGGLAFPASFPEPGAPPGWGAGGRPAFHPSAPPAPVRLSHSTFLLAHDARNGDPSSANGLETCRNRQKRPLFEPCPIAVHLSGRPCCWRRLLRSHCLGTGAGISGLVSGWGNLPAAWEAPVCGVGRGDAGKPSQVTRPLSMLPFLS